MQMLSTNLGASDEMGAGIKKFLKTVSDIVATIIVSIKGAEEIGIAQMKRIDNNSEVLKRGSKQLAPIFKYQTCVTLSMDT